MEEIIENEKKITAYYKVEESFVVESEEGGTDWVAREVLFKDGPLLKLRSNALSYCLHRMNEIDSRAEFSAPTPEAEMSAYRDPGQDWVPLPLDIDSYDKIVISSSLVIEGGENPREIIVFSIDPDSFLIDSISDEADYLLYNA